LQGIAGGVAGASGMDSLTECLGLGGCGIVEKLRPRLGDRFCELQIDGILRSSPQGMAS
jgi:hypothetical protein